MIEETFRADEYFSITASIDTSDTEIYIELSPGETRDPYNGLMLPISRIPAFAEWLTDFAKRLENEP